MKYDDLIKALRKTESSSESEQSDSDSSCGDFDKCKICNRKYPPQRLLLGTKSRFGTRKEITWVQCNRCDLWMHSVCEKATVQDLELDEYECNKCLFGY